MSLPLIVLIIIVVLVFGGYGYRRSPYYDSYGYQGGIGIGFGTVLLILLICWALGLFGGHSLLRF